MFYITPRFSVYHIVKIIKKLLSFQLSYSFLFYKKRRHLKLLTSSGMINTFYNIVQSRYCNKNTQTQILPLS